MSQDIFTLCANGDEEDVRRMIAADSAVVHARNWSKRTPLHYAVSEGHTAIVQLLLNAGADKDAKNNDNEIPLHIAAIEGHIAIVQLLLNEGADKDSKDNYNRTPLHWASNYGYTAIVQLLMNAEADKDAKEKDGKTALDIARENGHAEVVNLLEAIQKSKASQAERQRKITELAEDIQDLKAFLNTECGLTKAASGRCAEALAVDHGLGTVVVMKCEGREELTMILKSIGLSDKETELVLKVTHPLVPSDAAVASTLGAISTLPPISIANGGAKAATAPSPSSKSSLVSLPSIKIAPQVATPLFSLPTDILYHVFITHDWGSDESGRNNHETIRMLNEALKTRGIITWFDDDRMQGDIVQHMTDGIEKSACVLVAITQRYMAKVSGTNDNDNCKIEFGHAQRNKTAAKMIPVPIEPRCMSPQAWTGPVGGILGGQLYQANLAFDITADRARFEAEVDKIVARIGAICSKL